MKYSEFKLKAKKMRISLTDLSTIIGVGLTSMSNWKQIGIPNYAISIIELLEELPSDKRDEFLERKII
jgi:hypothetical protein